MTVQDLFSFEKMVTPVIIRVLYLLGIIGGFLYVLIAIIMVLQSNAVMMEYGQGMDSSVLAFSILTPVVLYVVGVFVWRLLLEAIIVIFQIYRNLVQATDALRAMQSQRNGGRS